MPQRWRGPPDDSMPSIYLDYAATSPIPPAVRDAMMPWFGEGFGNPSSVHGSGRRARNAIEASRDTLAGLLGVAPADLIFTSGGTESNFLAVSGFQGNGQRVSSPVEHEAVLQPVQSGVGHTARMVLPNEAGVVSVESVRPCLAKGTLASFMWVNNELGGINPVREIGEACREAGACLHTDAVQGPAWSNMNLSELGADLVTLSAHKVGGPKGIGLLYVAPGTPFKGVSPGGGQERNRRGGTENVPAIVGFAKAMELLYANPDRAESLRALTGSLRIGLRDSLGDLVRINTPDDHSAPHIVHVSVPGVPAGSGAEMVILGLDLEGIEVSAGSACASGALNASHVLKALGKAELASIRYSIGFGTTAQEIDRAVSATRRVIQRVLKAL
ncbi:MAG: cysteine desulfurase [Rhodothermales bacterium]